MTEHIVESSIAHRNCQLDENGYDQSTDTVIVIHSSLVKHSRVIMSYHFSICKKESMFQAFDTRVQSFC